MKQARRYILILASVVSTIVVAQQSPQAKTEDFPAYTLAPGQRNDNGEPTSGAKLCLLKRPDICYEMPRRAEPAAYEFGLAPSAERLPLPSGGSWVFFSATFSAGGSGSLDRFAILRYDGSDANGKIVNLLPPVDITNVGERAVWTIPGASDYPILVDANFIWGDGETHFDSHFFTIKAWRFDPAADRYVQAFSYRTATKYESEELRVLAPERPEIIRRLKAQ